MFEAFPFQQFQQDIHRLHIEIVAALLSTIFTAIHTVCAAYAADTQIRRGLQGSRRYLLFATAAMYIATVVSWIASLLRQFQYLSLIKGDVLGNDESVAGSSVITQYFVGSGTLTINVFIGDSIVWWRVWVLWNKNYPILVAGSLLLFATLGLGIGDFFTTGALFFTGPVGLSVIVLSLFSNIVSTSLVGYKSWMHRINTKDLRSTRVSNVNHIQRALILLFESGIVYCILWTFVIASEVWIITQQTFSGSQWLWANIMQYIVEGCLVSFVGIYPTLIITVISLYKPKIEQECTLSTMESIGSTLPPRPPIQVAVATHTKETVDGDARGNTVVLIGFPSSRDSDNYSDLTSKSMLEENVVIEA